jgi:hypothetical protein
MKGAEVDRRSSFWNKGGNISLQAGRPLKGPVPGNDLYW